MKKVPGLSVKSVALTDPEKGLADEVLNNCDVLIWWGHQKHTEISSEKAKEIVQRIKDGRLSLIALHSAHWSEPFVEEEAVAAEALGLAQDGGGRDLEVTGDLSIGGAGEKAEEEQARKIGSAEPVGGREGL